MVAVLAAVTSPLFGCSLGGKATSKGSGSTTTSSTVAAKGGGTPATTPMDGTVTRVDAVMPGMCFNVLPDSKQKLVAVLLVGCEDPHTHEAFATFKTRVPGVRVQTTVPPTTEGSSSTNGRGPTTTRRAAPATGYPGETRIRDDAEAQCVGAFEEWMGIPWTSSEYDVQSWWPSATSWARGDRSILCAAYRVTGGPTKGSARGKKE